ncbi:cytochrome P450 [Aspergillus bertholletiae]|uniref:Cytochrome P450 n=1 Tax=Aspergillus bertholletiae TaxID=1226010 RepID=A0A5N7BD53_9EURO|nr:cytochrome P450 [Aspergillus bertholletiae]
MLNSITLPQTPVSWALTCVTAVIFYLLSNVAYNIFLHPLARYPGPLSYAASRIPYFMSTFMGTLPLDMIDLHKRYGDIVRIAPDQLAFAHPDAWNEIYGRRIGSFGLEKPSWFFRPFEEDPPQITNLPNEEHRRLRRHFAHGFSDREIREQEPIIQGYINLLLQRLHEICREETIVISDWYNYVTFDIIGDLVFGEPFGCLKGSSYDKWIQTILTAGRAGIVIQALSFVPLLKQALTTVLHRPIYNARESLKSYTRQKMSRRMAMAGDRPDLIEALVKNKDKLSLGIHELTANAEILVFAGSETTATLLSGATYLILKNPEAHRRLVKEVRSAFNNQEEINLTSVAKLPFMLACLDEALRMYPPNAVGLPRVCAAVHQFALYRREEYFTDPNTFHPERFLQDPRFLNDRRDMLQPFHVGPRDCLGRNLAYTEMRLILAHIIFNFDMKLSDDSQDWIQQKNHVMWKKGPLKVQLTPINKNGS